MTADAMIGFAQILPVLYIAVHFTIEGLARLRAITIVFAAAAELLLLINIATGEDPEPIVTLLALGSAALMLFTLSVAAFRRVNKEHDQKGSERASDD